MKYTIGATSLIVSIIAIFTFLQGAYYKLATKEDLRRIGIVSDFKYAESNIKINDLQLDALDLIKLTRPLKSSEQRNYESIEKSTERMIKAQEVILESQNIIN